ncbi:hypothetical protein AALP_AA4G200200 [Arabis alpina]|uniref:Nuclear pore protein n=1 Tax=Arabis alpina TaxID=50452 RepID=A0A087H4F5_ARAAL|nr:hypothetical protein AALP_AA4G200200 [Arabis alpina]
MDITNMVDTSIEAHAGSSSGEQLVALANRPMHEKKAYVFGEIVKKLNTSRERGLPYHPAMCFKDAYESIGAEIVPNAKLTNMQKIWQLVEAMTGEDSTLPQGVSKRMSLAINARRYLQREHEKQIMDTIQSHPTQASLGGSVGNLQRIRAFLRIRLGEYGRLDFDPPDARSQPPIDTTWQQIYFCLRTGYYEEAMDIARSTPSSQQLAPLLTEWITKDGMVAAETSAIASKECDKMDDPLGRTAYDKMKLLVYTIISGSPRQIDSLPSPWYPSALFNTIEDLLWFLLSCIRDVAGGSSSVVLNDGLAPYSLDDLQAYLNASERLYSTEYGNSPFQYAYLMLLSIQLLPAILNLSIKGWFIIDAVHIAISVLDHSVLSKGSETGLVDANAEASSMLRRYGSMFLQHGDLQMTVEYYAQAAVIVGGGQLAWSGRSDVDQQRQRNLMLKQLLTEILLREGGIYFLLGASGSGEDGQLGRFFPDSRLRQQLLVEAAQQCQEAGLYEESIEIRKRVGAFSAALETVNKCLSEAICSLARGRLDGESRTSGLILAGNDILQTYKYYPEVSLQERELVMEQETILRQLEAILSIHKLGKRGNHLDALREIAKLPFIHLDPRVPDVTVDVFPSASPYFQTCVPDLLKVALTCLDNVYDTGASVHAMRSKIAGFLASNMPNSSVFSSSEPKLQEAQIEALLRKTESLKSELESLQIMNGRLHGSSCEGLSFPELQELQSQLRQGMVNVEDQQRRMKMENDNLVEEVQASIGAYRRQMELSKKRRVLRLGAEAGRRFREERQPVRAPVKMKKKIKYMKREIKRLKLWNERMVGKAIDGMSFIELMVLKKDMRSALIHVQHRMILSRKGKEEEEEEELSSVANGVETLKLEACQPVELDIMQTGEFMIKYCSKLRMSQQAVKAAKEAVVKCSEFDIIRRSPFRSIIAVVLYIITQLSDDKKSLKDVLKATGVAEVTIRNSYKDLYPHFAKIVPSWYAKEEDLKNLSSP